MNGTEQEGTTKSGGVEGERIDGTSGGKEDMEKIRVGNGTGGEGKGVDGNGTNGEGNWRGRKGRG